MVSARHPRESNQHGLANTTIVPQGEVVSNPDLSWQLDHHCPKEKWAQEADLSQIAVSDTPFSQGIAR